LPDACASAALHPTLQRLSTHLAMRAAARRERKFASGLNRSGGNQSALRRRFLPAVSDGLPGSSRRQSAIAGWLFC